MNTLAERIRIVARSLAAKVYPDASTEELDYFGLVVASAVEHATLVLGRTSAGRHHQRDKFARIATRYQDTPLRIVPSLTMRRGEVQLVDEATGHTVTMINVGTDKSRDP